MSKESGARKMVSNGRKDYDCHDPRGGKVQWDEEDGSQLPIHIGRVK